MRRGFFWPSGVITASFVLLAGGGLIAATSTPSDRTVVVPIEPVRLLDTRAGSRVGSVDIDGKSTPLRLQIAGAKDFRGTTDSGIPKTDVRGVVANVTVTSTDTNQYGGFVSMYPCASTTARPPEVSTLNFVAGQTVANGVTVPVSDDGFVCIYVYGLAHVLLDANGYLTPAENAAVPVDLSGYYTSSEVDALVAGKADSGDVATLRSEFEGLPDYATPAEVDAAMAEGDARALESWRYVGGLTGAFTHEMNLYGASTDTGYYIDSTALSDGIAIAFHDEGNGDLYFQRCYDAACAELWEAGATPIAGPDVGEFVDIESWGDDQIAISFIDGSQGHLLATQCASDSVPNNCWAPVGGAATLSTSAHGPSTMSVTDDGLMRIAYQRQDFSLGLIVCGDSLCTSVTGERNLSSRGLPLDSAVDSAGRVRVAYADGVGDLRLITCSDSNCATWTDEVLNDGAMRASLAVSSDGVVFVASVRYDGDLELRICRTDTCSRYSTVSIASGGIVAGLEIALDRNGYPMVAYTKYWPYGIRLFRCLTAECSLSRDDVVSPGFSWWVSLLSEDGYAAISHSSDDQVKQTLWPLE